MIYGMHSCAQRENSHDVNAHGMRHNGYSEGNKSIISDSLPVSALNAIIGMVASSAFVYFITSHPWHHMHQ